MVFGLLGKWAIDDHFSDFCTKWWGNDPLEAVGRSVKWYSGFEIGDVLTLEVIQTWCTCCWSFWGISLAIVDCWFGVYIYIPCILEFPTANFLGPIGYNHLILETQPTFVWWLPPWNWSFAPISDFALYISAVNRWVVSFFLYFHLFIWRNEINLTFIFFKWVV